jgi:hypothetical protein
MEQYSSVEDLYQRMEAVGYNIDYDVEYSDDIFEPFNRTNLGLGDLIGKDVKSYRDSKPMNSLHVKDYRESPSATDIIIELERFNPRYPPLMHILIDFPMWFLKNRVRH